MDLFTPCSVQIVSINLNPPSANCDTRSVWIGPINELYRYILCTSSNFKFLAPMCGCQKPEHNLCFKTGDLFLYWKKTGASNQSSTIRRIIPPFWWDCSEKQQNFLYQKLARTFLVLDIFQWYLGVSGRNTFNLMAASPGGIEMYH